MRIATIIPSAGAALAAAALIALPAAAAPTTSSAQAAGKRHFEGRVTAVNRAQRSFRLRDSERGSVRIVTVTSTTYQRVAGFSGLRKGLRVEATVRRTDGNWIATRVEGRRGRQAGDDNGGRRGGGNHDRGGDDHGRDRGHDDGPNHT